MTNPFQMFGQMTQQFGNPINFLQAMMGGNANPQAMVIQMLEANANNNPMFQNLLNLARNNKGAEIETVVRNYMKEKGFDFDKEFGNFMNMYGNNFKK